MLTNNFFASMEEVVSKMAKFITKKWAGLLSKIFIQFSNILIYIISNKGIILS